jgi:hypothetical protein
MLTWDLELSASFMPTIILQLEIRMLPYAGGVEFKALEG